MTKNYIDLLNDKSDIYLGCLVCIMAICIFIVTISMDSVIGVIGSILSFSFGVYGLKTTYKARKRLKEDMKRLECWKNLTDIEKENQK